MSQMIVSSSAPPITMSTKSTCSNKENIRTKKYEPTSDDTTEVNKHAQCQSPVPDGDKQVQELNKCDESGETETGNSNNKKKFVEAPLPKTNPWTANINAAHIVRPKVLAREKEPNVGEKRILQPQQQTVCEYRLIFECLYIFKFLDQFLTKMFNIEITKLPKLL